MKYFIEVGHVMYDLSVSDNLALINSISEKLFNKGDIIGITLDNEFTKLKVKRYVYDFEQVNGSNVLSQVILETELLD